MSEKSLAAAIDELKSSCNVCHYGKSKKNRNDYAKALDAAGLEKDKFSKDRVKAEPDKVKAEIIAAWKRSKVIRRATPPSANCSKPASSPARRLKGKYSSLQVLIKRVFRKGPVLRPFVYALPENVSRMA